MSTKVIRTYLISLIIFSISDACLAQPAYTRVSDPFERISYGQTRWADLDNDNDLDVIYTGQSQTFAPATLVYENVGGSFTMHATTLPGVSYGAIAMGDYDNDGDLDVLISGSSSNVDDRVAAIFRNDGGFVFTEQYTFPGLSNANGEWADLDNDEDLDVILTGIPGSSWGPGVTLVYENSGTGFTEVSGTNLPDCMCIIDVADGNGDGKSDILLSDLQGNMTRLYLNNGNLEFAEDTRAGFRPGSGNVRWGDFDKDGDLDVALTGDSGGTYNSLIYENKNGNTRESLVERTDIPLLGMGGNNQRGTQWLDYNNDGKLDLLIAGRSSGIVNEHRLYRNNGGSFTETIEPGINALDGQSLDPGDYDNDGDLDLAFLGYNYVPMGGSFSLAGYYKNFTLDGSAVTNTKPLPPSPATFNEKGYRREIRFSWGDGTDAQTPALALTYNFYLRDALQKLVVPNVNFSTGYVRTANAANGFGRRGFANMVPEGNLYYAVQAVDGARAGSVFSGEKMFYHFNGPESIDARILDDGQVKLTWLDHSSLETNYDIVKSTSANSGFVPLATLPANTITFTDSNFLTDTYYYYRIKGLNASHTSPYDSLILMIPKPPTSLVATSVNGTNVHLTWTDHSSFESGFLLERRISGEPDFIPVDTLAANVQSYDDLGVEPCTTYDYRIRAISPNGGLLPTALASARTNCLPVGIDFQIETPEDVDRTFTIGEFQSNFTDADAGDQLVRVKILTLPETGNLRISGALATIGQEISLSQLALTSYDTEPDFNGSTSFTLSIFDGTDYSVVPWTISMVVTEVNDPPAFDLTATYIVSEDFAGERLFFPSMHFIPYETDVSITFTVSPTTSDKISIAIDAATGTLSLTAIANQFGEVQLTMTADDGQSNNNTFSRTLTFTITPVNDRPVFGAIANIDADLIEPIPPVVLNVTDIDNVIVPSMFSGVSTSKQVLADEDITFTANSSNEVLMNLHPKKAGATSVTIIVDDGAAQVTSSFILTVISITGIDDLPALSIFPNPFVEEVRLSWREVWNGNPTTVLIRDILGRVVASREFQSAETIIPTGHLANGIYLLEISSANCAPILQKIIKN